MKNLIICNGIMGPRKEKTGYASTGNSLKVSSDKFLYPVSAFLSENMVSGQEYKVLLIMKRDSFNRYEQNISDFKEEIEAVAASKGGVLEVVPVLTDFSQRRAVHEGLLETIVEHIEEGSNILADITYGPKDVPFVVFAALNFAEKFLNCEINHIIYGKADFDNKNAPVNTEVWDLAPIYFINSVTNSINCSDSEEAKEMLKALLSI